MLLIVLFISCFYLLLPLPCFFFFFFFNDTATTEIYTLSLHDALPIYRGGPLLLDLCNHGGLARLKERSEEHTSELQSRLHLVCRLLLEKKKKINMTCRTHPRHPAIYDMSCND